MLIGRGQTRVQRFERRRRARLLHHQGVGGHLIDHARKRTHLFFRFRCPFAMQKEVLQIVGGDTQGRVPGCTKGC